jgi:GTP cyclohydrolase II
MGGRVIARQWAGETLGSDAETYGKYLEEAGIKEIKASKGNQGVWLLRRVHEGRAEFIVISMWVLLRAAIRPALH